jgi:hypothetical protein
MVNYIRNEGIKQQTRRHTSRRGNYKGEGKNEEVEEEDEPEGGDQAVIYLLFHLQETLPPQLLYPRLGCL